MGEAWSDWYAMDFLVGRGPADRHRAPARSAIGGYTDADRARSAPRRWTARSARRRRGCPAPASGRGAGRLHLRRLRRRRRGPGGPRRRRDLGPDAVELRKALIAEHGADRRLERARALRHRRHAPLADRAVVPRHAQRHPAGRPGPRRHDHDLIWQVFARARHGLLRGERGDLDAAPREDFSGPPAPGGPTGIVRGVVRDDTGGPVPGALVGLGGHDGPPGAGPALQARPRTDGAYEITGIPQARYPRPTVDAPAGYADAIGGSVTVGRRAGNA